MNTLSPIVLFVYNRPWHTKQTIESLLKNELAKKSELIIYSDGAKNADAEKGVQQVRRYITSISGFKRIKIIEREDNWGLANSIIDGVSSVVDKYQKVIVLEDDLVTSSSFLNYMNESLELYKNNKEVVSIHGYIYPINGLPDAFFLKGADCWGWATWKRSWDIFEISSEKLLKELKQKHLQKEADFNNSYNFTKMLQDNLKGKNDSWAIRWYMSAFLKDMLTLYPGKSLIQNIGLDASGSHCGVSNSFLVDLSSKQIFSKIPVKEGIKERKKIETYFRSIKASYLQTLKNRITGLFYHA